jgi:hypothetical protein
MPHVQGVEDSVYRLTRDWRVRGRLDDGRAYEIEIREGFEFDGCSIPRALWRLCGHPCEVPRVAAALAHDFLYRSHICERDMADAIFRQICADVGIGKIRRNIEYATLRVAGFVAWNGHDESTQKAARQMGTLMLDAPENLGIIKRRPKIPETARLTAKAAIALVATLILDGCYRSIEIIRKGDDYSARYRSVGYRTDVDAIEIEKSPDGNVRVKVNGLKTDVSAENKEIVSAGGTAVGNVAEKVIEGIKKVQ